MVTAETAGDAPQKGKKNHENQDHWEGPPEGHQQKDRESLRL